MTPAVTSATAAEVSSSRERKRNVVLCGTGLQSLPLHVLRSSVGFQFHPPAAFSRDDEQRLLALRPDCALVSAADPAALETCRAIRFCSPLRTLPIIAVVEDPWSDQPGRALAAGADDFLPESRTDSLAWKIAALEEVGASATPVTSGRALVADRQPARRAQLGRYLQRLGLEIQFAQELEPASLDPALRLVVMHADLLPESWQHGSEAHPSGPSTPWIITGSGDVLRDLGHSFSSPDCSSQIGFLDLNADTSQVIFIANRLLKPGPALRSSKRLPFERPIRIGWGGAASAFWGFIYNISAGGLYVRTLTPPPVETLVSLEFQPPHGKGRVLVDGVVRWRQRFCGEIGYPPGFGLTFQEPLPVADAAALSAGYSKLLEELGDLLQ